MMKNTCHYCILAVKAIVFTALKPLFLVDHALQKLGQNIQSENNIVKAAHNNGAL